MNSQRHRRFGGSLHDRIRLLARVCRLHMLELQMRQPKPADRLEVLLTEGGVTADRIDNGKGESR